MRTSITFLLITLLLTGVVAAQTYVTSNIVNNTTWGVAGSPYIIQANIDVLGGRTLTIEAGVTVAFDDYYYLNTAWNGVIVANGAPGNRVVFTSNSGSPELGDWQYVQVFGDAASAFSYCLFEYGGNGLRANTAAPVVTHCEFRECARGVFCYFGSPLVQHCDLVENWTGVYITGNTCRPVVHNCDIHDNVNYNVFVQSFPEPAAVIDMENNWWGTAVESEIAGEIVDAVDGGLVYATIDFDPWLEGVPNEDTNWGHVKTLYAR